MIKHLLVTVLFLACCVGLRGQDFGDEGWCQANNNVNCDNWPPALSNSKRSVFLINSGGSNCTGTLINQNVSAGRLRYYFLTAKHCIDGQDLNAEWSFFFNFQSPDCNNASVPVGNAPAGNRNAGRYQHRTRVRLVDEKGMCDMALLEMLTPPPPHFKVYFAGWSVSPGQGLQLPYYDIHHPGGSIKKIAKTHSTFTQTSYSCHTVTKVVDGLLRLFGIGARTETICSYTESPYYYTPFWSNGVVEPGSSGSALFNSNARVIGALSGGASSCNFPLLEAHGRLSTFWNRSGPARQALNPDDQLIFGVPGQEILCYPATTLSGNYYPASDYQPQNRITLSSSDRFTLGGATPLTVFPRADFDIQAANGITLLPGVTIQPGANLRLSVRPCSAGARTSFQADDGLKSIAAGNNPEAAGSPAELFSAHPNPFSQTTSIRYRLAQAGPVKIRVTTLLGREIAVLVNATDHPAGEHQVEFRAAGLPAGVYLYTLSTNGFAQTKRMIISK